MSQKYYPYFRGRQFELIALRELVTAGKLSPDIIPVIEPVKASSTLITTIKAFNDNGREIAIVVNPEYGNFIEEVTSAQEPRQGEMQSILSQPNVKRALIQNGQLDVMLPALKDQIVGEGDRWIAIYTSGEYLDKSVELSKKYGIKYTTNLIPDEAAFRRKLRGLGERISFKDVFRKRSRNSDYKEMEDELFTEEHVYAKDDGYSGTGDYSIVGGDYIDSGFAPYAVAIHIVYRGDEKSLRVHHFVSDSNDGIDDPAGKFSEAARKMVSWYNDHKDVCPRTMGLGQLIDIYEAGMYPGLGALKKFTIMHHLEVMGEVLNGML